MRATAANGIKHSGEIALTPEPGPTPSEVEVLNAVVDEAAKVGGCHHSGLPERHR